MWGHGPDGSPLQAQAIIIFLRNLSWCHKSRQIGGFKSAVLVVLLVVEESPDHRADGIIGTIGRVRLRLDAVGVEAFPERVRATVGAFDPEVFVALSVAGSTQPGVH